MNRLRFVSFATLLAVAMLGAPGIAQVDSLPNTARPSPAPPEPGLLFYLSADHGFNADFAAGGNAAPNYLSDVKILPGGAKGSYLQCGNHQLLSYWAPGNIYAQRGTLSFYWRSRDPVDETAFPIFRVGYADHSSWDQVWLRIDYNGHGFDAFVTDVNLGRTRVSYDMPSFPKPDQWVHLTLTWDETSGIRFYVDGKMVAEKAATGMFDAGLDQFGPHSRIIGPTGVESTYSYDRGGDLDELRIYDRALSDENVASLAKGETPRNIPPVTRSLANADTQKEWWFHYGWNRPGDIPAPLPATNTTIRKVQINDAFDIGRWWWRANDGIRETTWPGVYNRSRLVGRFDYFQLPDWDCYAISGKTVTFIMPQEPWNHLELNGGAFGNMTLLTPDVSEDAVRRSGLDGTTLPGKTLFERPSGQETTFHDYSEPITGGKLRFTNVEQETPIGEFSAYYVHPGDPPAGIVQLKYRLSASTSPDDNPSLTPLVAFIHDRYPADERSLIIGMPGGAGGGGGGRLAAARAKAPRGKGSEPGLPIVHILIPADFRGLPAETTHVPSYTWDDIYAGLDGIAIDLPALNVKPTHGDYVPMNIEVRDPLWPMRDMLNFTFSVKPGEPHTLWLDTRDRILPNDRSLLITIASASAEFNAEALDGAEVRLIFKPYKDAAKEHVADRLTQVRDNFSNMTEEHVNSRRLNTYNRFYADITDLLRVDPANDLGRKYWHEWNPETAWPDYTPPTVPAGVPAWAYLQAKDVDYFQRIADFFVDKRQAWDGEFGGGLGDDSDFTNLFPSLALMGTEPEKLKRSLSRELEAMYENKMWTNGLATGQFDELHSYEDGLNVLGQSLMMDFGNPKDLERAMVTAKRLEWLTGINAAGHRHIRSAYFSGAKMAEGGVWGWTKARGYMDFHPALDMVLFNGAPETRKMVLETVDGMLAHRKREADGRWVTRTEINFKTDEDLPGGDATPDFMFWAAYRWTGDKKYLLPFMDAGPSSLAHISSDALDMLNLRDTWGKQVVAAAGTTDPATGVAATAAQSITGSAETFAWQVSGDTKYLDRLYAAQLEAESNREWINTEGSLWIDRVTDSAGPMFVNTELQRARFGGVALIRNHIYPGNAVSWRFVAPATPSSLGILVPEATPDHLKIIVYNLDAVPVKTQMTGWEIDPGKWEITQGTRGNAETDPVQNVSTRSESFERSISLDFTFAPHTTTVLELKLVEKGVPYWSRPDLGIGADDVKVEGNRMKVTIHSLGAVDAPASKVVLRDGTGKVLATAHAAALKAPVDLLPKTEVVSLTLPPGANWKGGSVSVEISGKLPEITQMNNKVQF